MSYSFYRTITIDHTKVGGSDHSNFPVPLIGTYSWLKTVANGGDVESSSGYDIIFRNADGTANLDFERVSWDGSTGLCEFWVRVPTLSHTTDTVIRVYYKNAGITTDQQNRAGAWESHYKAVWHFPNGTTLSLSDSTGNANNATINGTVTAAAGQIDGGAAISNASNNNFMYKSSTSSLSPTTAITISAWVKSSQGSLANIVVKNLSWYFTIGGSTSGKLGFWIEGRNSSWTEGTTGVADGTLRHLAATFDGTTERVYVNATQEATASLSGAIIAGSQDIIMGTRRLSGLPQYTNPFDGVIDEVRISDIARSADWLTAEYNSGNDPSTFYSVGDPVPCGALNPFAFFMTGGRAS